MKYFFSLIFLLLLSVPTASAKAPDRLEVQGLAITPFLIEVDTKPEQKTDHSIAITNTTNEVLPINISVNDFVPTENGQPRFLDTDHLAKEQYSLAKWIKITIQPEFTIAPGATTELKFSITPPQNAEPGTHYGGVLFSYRFPQDKNGNTQVEQKVGAIILASLGKGNQQGKITALYHTQPSNKTLDFSATFNNFGNTHLVPKGDITISNSFGRTVGNIPLNRDGLVVLPETQKSFTTTWESNKTLFGRYTFTAVSYFGNPKLESRYSVSVWILPVRLLITTILFGCIIIILVILGIKRYNKYIIKHHSDS